MMGVTLLVITIVTTRPSLINFSQELAPTFYGEWWKTEVIEPETLREDPNVMYDVASSYIYI